MRISEDVSIRNRSNGCSQEYESKAVALLLPTQMHRAFKLFKVRISPGEEKQPLVSNSSL
jgi:hypothetical protein